MYGFSLGDPFSFKTTLMWIIFGLRNYSFPPNHQTTYHPNKQHINQPIYLNKKSNNHTIDQPTKLPTALQHSQPLILWINQKVHQPDNRLTNTSTNTSTSQCNKHLTHQITDQPTSVPSSQPTGDLISQHTNQNI